MDRAEPSESKYAAPGAYLVVCHYTLRALAARGLFDRRNATVVVDEYHLLARSMSRFWTPMMAPSATANVLLLSATPPSKFVAAKGDTAAAALAVTLNAIKSMRPCRPATGPVAAPVHFWPRSTVASAPLALHHRPLAHASS